MRAKEFITEIKLDIPNQMVTVQISLSDLVSANETDDEDVVINPGKRAGKNGKYKWSPPLQQHLDSVKDSVGPSNDEIDVDAAEEEELAISNKARNKNIAPRTIIPSVLG